MNTQTYMMDLILRAPECPDDFRPSYPEPEYSEGEIAAIDSGVPTFRYLQFQREYKVKRLIEWPSYYAKQVMEAAGEPVSHDNFVSWTKDQVDLHTNKERIIKEFLSRLQAGDILDCGNGRSLALIAPNS